MNIRRLNYILLGALSVLTSWFNVPLCAAPAAEPVMQVHWLGMNHISTDPNAARFMSVWKLPQTAALLTQTLDKLSRWPGGGATNAASVLIRPLLDDLVSSETFLEIFAPTNNPSTIHHPPSSLLIAVRLSADRAQLWQTNLAAVRATLIAPNAPVRIECSKAGQWTLVDLGQGSRDLKSEFTANLPQGKSTGPNWLETDLNPSRLADIGSRSTGGTDWGDLSELFAINSQLSTLNSLHLSVNAESNCILTHAILDFSRQLDLRLPSWKIPTNLIHAPLTSFTAVRGLSPWLATFPAWQKFQINPPPNQAFFWAQDGLPFQTYFTVPLPEASSQLSRLADRLLQKGNAWLANNAEGNFQLETNLPGIFWKNVSLIEPFLKPATAQHQDYVLGGLMPLAKGNSALLPDEIMRAVLNTTNLVYYQSQQTGQRIEDGFFITQIFRIIFHKPQLPAVATATLWLKNVEPKLGGSTTIITQTGSAQLSFIRSSTIGFTALELHLLADWLESPQFPHGLHTFLAPPD